MLRLQTEPQIPVGLAAEQAGWRNVGYPTNAASLRKLMEQATFAADDLDDELGGWPAAHSRTSVMPSATVGSAP